MLPRFKKNVDDVRQVSCLLQKTTWLPIISSSPASLSTTNLDALSQITHLLDNIHKYLSDDEKTCLQDAQIIRDKCKENASFKPQVADLKLLVKAAKIKQKTERASRAAEKGHPFQEINNKDLIRVGEKIEELLGYINNAQQEIQSKYTNYLREGNNAFTNLNNALNALSDEVNAYCSIFVQELMSRINGLSSKEIYDIRYVTDQGDWMRFNAFITKHGSENQKQELANKYSLMGNKDVVPLSHDDVYHVQEELGVSFIELPEDDMMKSIVIMSPEKLDASLSDLKGASEKITVVQDKIIQFYDQEKSDDLDDISTWEVMQKSMTMSFQLVTVSSAAANVATTKTEKSSFSATPSSSKTPVVLQDERVVISLEEQPPVKKKSHQEKRETHYFPVSLYDAISDSPQAQLKSLLKKHLQRLEKEQQGCWYNVFASHDMQRRTRDKITALYTAIGQLDQPKTPLQLAEFLESLLKTKSLTQSRGGWLNSTLEEALQECRQCSMKKRY